MTVKAIFKSVTCESLSDPKFMRIASEAIPLLDTLHDKCDAAEAAGQRDGNTAPSWERRKLLLPQSGIESCLDLKWLANFREARFPVPIRSP
jgi:hypothetical protein